MIHKDCPLSDKDKFYVTMHGDCEYSAEHFGEKKCCAKCPYSFKFRISDIFGVQAMSEPVGTIFKLKRKKNDT